MKYIFRGITVFDYNEKTGELLTTAVEGTNIPAINFCKYIDEDFILMEQFFNTINKLRTTGETVELKDIEVY